MKHNALCHCDDTREHMDAIAGWINSGVFDRESLEAGLEKVKGNPAFSLDAPKPYPKPTVTMVEQMLHNQGFTLGPPPVYKKLRLRDRIGARVKRFLKRIF